MHGYMNVCLHQVYLHECGYGVYIMCVLNTDMYMCVYVCSYIWIYLHRHSCFYTYAGDMDMYDKCL